jgi:inhibitor of cysteine peptidase
VSPQTYIAGRERQHDPIHLGIGDSLRIELAENPSTGFLWYLLHQAGPCLEFESREYAPIERSGVGAGGVRMFRFRAKESGHERLAFGLSQPWQRSAIPEDSCEFEVTVA